MSLPGADELFRTTGGVALQPSTPRRTPSGSAAAANGEAARVPAPAGEPDPAAEGPETAAAHRRRTEKDGTDAPATAGDGGPATPPPVPPVAPAAEHSGRETDGAGSGSHRTRASRQAAPEAGAAATAPATGRRRGARGANRRPSGRERHDEKITVYVSAEELMDLEHARLVLRGEHGLAVDRGRIVREAVAVVLADLESRGDASILVRRLRGR
ncbi:hypothetical protein JCM4914_58630 [Streptomyces platensis subsp. malvinus]